MVMKNEIYTIIRNDVPLRKKIADHLGVTDSTVYGHAVRKAPKLNEYPIVRIIMEHTRKKEDEVFDLEIKNTQ